LKLCFDDMAKRLCQANVYVETFFEEKYRSLSNLGSGSYDSGSLAFNQTKSAYYIENIAPSIYYTAMQYTSQVYDLGSDLSAYDWYCDWVSQEHNYGYIDPVEIRHSDSSGAISGLAWESIVMNQKIAKNNLGQFFQFRLSIYASGSSEVKFYGLNLKGR
jgi:hypothetical protein